MEQLNDYLTREGWKRDFGRTCRDIYDFVNIRVPNVSRASFLTGTAFATILCGYNLESFGMCLGGTLTALTGLHECINGYYDSLDEKLI